MFLDAILRRVSTLIESQRDADHPVRLPAFDPHVALAHTLAAGDAIAADPTGALRALGVIAPTTAEPSPLRGSTAMGYVRTLPPGGAFDVRNVPAWAHGMHVDQSAGPFIDEHGIPSFIDSIVPDPATMMAIVRAPAGTIIAYVQSETVEETSAGGTTTVTFGAGSIWLMAGALAPDAPVGGFAGIAFSAAMLTVPGGFASAPVPELSLPATTTASLAIVPALAAALPPGLSNDGTRAVGTLPASVLFALTPDGIMVTALAEAQLRAYGQSVRLAGTNGASPPVRYDADARALVVSFGAASEPAPLRIGVNVSSTLRIAGSAPISAASYRIPVAVTMPANLAAAESGGALAIELGSGLRVQWGNLVDDVALSAALIQVETGMLGLHLTTADQTFSDTYALWDAGAPGTTLEATTITLTGGPGTQIDVVETQAVQTISVIGCATNANLDRPQTVDGTTARFDRLRLDYVCGRTLRAEILLAFGVPGGATEFATDIAPIETFVIRDAAVRTRGLDGFLLFATMSGRRAAQGVILTGSPLEREPHARGEMESQRLGGAVRWTSLADVQLSFALSTPDAHAGSAAG